MCSDMCVCLKVYVGGCMYVHVGCMCVRGVYG